jgi:hypothetical protein
LPARPDTVAPDGSHVRILGRVEGGRNRFEGSGRALLDNPEVRTMYLGGALVN